MTGSLLGVPARSTPRLPRTMAVVLAGVCAVTATTGLAGRAGAAALPSAPQVTVVPEAGTTLWVDGRPYAGQVTVAPDRAGLAVVNRVGFEDYVSGIGEMPSSWPAAALQAQAVAARTYALWTILTHQPGPGGGQICASDYCQVYAGLAKTQGPGGANWLAAVQATSGQVLTYGGRVIESLYGSSDGGRTVSGGVAWLPSVADPDDALAPEHQWSWTKPLTEFARLLDVPAGQKLVGLVSSPTAITETLRSTSGAPTTRTLDPSSFHSLLNARASAPGGLDLPLPSWRYSVSTYGTDVQIAGYGDGQGMGMSQYGALGKAERGWTAGQILGGYYPGTSLTRLPGGEQPTAISVTLADPVPSATVGATGPVQILGPDGRVLATTTGPSSWLARPGGSGVGLLAEPGGPPGSLPATLSLAPPAPITAPDPGRAATAPPTPAPTAPPATTPPTQPAAPPSVAAAYQDPLPSPRHPTGWAAAALIVLLAVGGATARVARTRWALTTGPVLRPVGAHYRARARRARPTANG